MIASDFHLRGLRADGFSLRGLRADAFHLADSVPSSLITGLIGFWKLADLTDAFGGFTLTNNGGVTFTTGKVGNAASLASASSQYLSRAHAAALSPTGDMTLSAWVKFNTLTGNRPVVMKALDLATASSTEWGIYYSSSANRIRAWYRNGAAAANINGDVLGAPATGTWYHCLLRIASGVVSLNINGGAANTASGITRATTTQDLFFGRVLVASTPAYLDGLLDAVGLWGRAVSDSEAAALYASGNGIEFPFT